MIQKPLIFLCIDLFCGAGGITTGMENAMHLDKKCAEVVACINHDPFAIESHALNHGNVVHFREDIRNMDISKLVQVVLERRCYWESLGYQVKIILHASLECTNFSNAKGGKPRDADSRSLAEHMDKYIIALNPDYFTIENVRELRAWGPLDANGKPISRDKGKTYTKWVKSIKKLGYHFDHRILNAADYGEHTSRKRFFGIFAKKGNTIIFPLPTHSKKGDTLPKWKPVKNVLDFDDEGASIFYRQKPLVEKTLARVYAGLIKYVACGKEAFLSTYYSGDDALRNHSLDEPCGVVPTENRHALVSAKFITKYYSGLPEGKISGMEEPCGTLTTSDRMALVQPDFLMQDNSGEPDSKICDINAPSRTITCSGGKLKLIQPKYLTKHYSCGENISSMEEPCGAVTTKDRFSVVSPQWMDMQYSTGQKDKSIDEPAGSVTTKPKHRLISYKPFLMDTAFSNTTNSIDEPAPVITASRHHRYIINPQWGGNGGDIEKPCCTVIARMDKAPLYLVTTATGELAIQIEETDSDMTIKIKEFMALYGIIDIKMRMLKIPELLKIQGFPDGYKLVGTSTKQKWMIGNAQPPLVMTRWVESLYNTNLNTHI